jgi:uncharacterized protein YkwD
MQLVSHPLTALLILLGAGASLCLMGSSPASAGSTYADRMESSVIVATNHARVQRDRRAVRGNACVDRMAESWARHLAETTSLTHRRLGRVLSRCNRSYVSENLAKYPVSSGMTAAQVARRTVRAWMHSAEHRHNLLSTRPRVIGLGAARSATGTWFIVQNFAR